MTTASTATKKTSEAQVATNGTKPVATEPEFKMIPLDDLFPSPTNPRRRIDDQSIASLAGSIGTQGVLEPLIVRQKDKKYEIVCGERRYRASQVIPQLDKDGKPTGETYSLKVLPCLVRELTDEQVLDIQIHENLHREDVHPMDEAYGYQFLKEKLGCDEKELALRVGKSEGYVLNRLKLNRLIDEAQKDVDDGVMPLTYALEIAKYSPEIQKEIYGEVYRTQGRYKDDEYVYEPIKGELVPFKSLLEWINTNIHCLLAKAPFDPKAINLRADGLACIKCPERTGAAVSLFEPNQIGKKDACLNPVCFVQKAKTHVDVRRAELAELRKVDLSEVPIVRSWSHSNGEGYLGSESAVVVSGSQHDAKKGCKKTIGGVDIERDNYGRTVEVCLRSSGCKIHWPEPRTSTNGEAAETQSSETADAARLEASRARREEIWNAKVAEAVRVRVFKQAAERFEKKFRIADVGTDLLSQLLARFWTMTGSGDQNNLNAVVKRIVSEWESVADKKQGIDLSNSWKLVEVFKKLDRPFQFRILFLLIHCHKGFINARNDYASQKEVQGLAGEFDINYALIDAEVRVEFCAKKHNEAHEKYLNDVRQKLKDAKVPRLFSEKWKPAD